MKCDSEIEIFVEEIEEISKLSNGKLEELAFACLVYDKICSKKFPRLSWLCKNDSLLFNLAKNKCNKTVRKKLLSQLCERKVIRVEARKSKNFIARNSSQIQAKFQVLCRKEKGKVAFKVNDLENLICYYKNFKGQGSFCAKCASPIEKNSNRQKYCKNCAKVIKNEQNKMAREENRKFKIA